MAGDRGRRHASGTAVLLVWGGVVLWVMAVMLAAAVFVLLIRAPDTTVARSVFITAGAFLTFAIPAAGVTVAAVVFRHRRRNP